MPADNNTWIERLHDPWERAVLQSSDMNASDFSGMRFHRISGNEILTAS